MAAERLESAGLGPSPHVDTNQTSAGRTRSRRVELVVQEPVPPEVPVQEARQRPQ